MFNFLKKGPVGQVTAPVAGSYLPIEQVTDEVFASKAVGDGFAITPDERQTTINAPIDGVVSSIFPTKHAIMITTKQNVEILIHMGIDTVELKGAPFTMHVEAGDRVKAGEAIVDIDWQQLAAAQKATTIMVVSSNATFVPAEPLPTTVTTDTIIGQFDLAAE